MELLASFPIVVTDRLAECRDLYTRWFGFEVVFEASWIVVLSGTGGDVPALAFMHSSHPSSPPDRRRLPAARRSSRSRLRTPRASSGGSRRRPGVLARADRRTVGQRRFAAVDPAGMWVDVVEQIEPAAGWWDRYVQGDHDRYRGPLP
jgi:catechol 2,3-dioxygenase-like lactoylglutathione lyase family enzyme